MLYLLLLCGVFVVLFFFFFKDYSNSTAYIAQFSVLDVVFQVQLKECKGSSDIVLGPILAYLKAEMELLLGRF